MIYKLLQFSWDSEPKYVVRNNPNETTTTCIPFDPANTDYQAFKAQIDAEEAQLQDADGNTLSAEEAKEFIKELP